MHKEAFIQKALLASHLSKAPCSDLELRENPHQCPDTNEDCPDVNVTVISWRNLAGARDGNPKILEISIKGEKYHDILGITDFMACPQDFAFESDGQRMRKAAHLMVTSLAGSMALVSCRDAMRASLSSQLRALLADLTGTAAIEEEVRALCSAPLSYRMQSVCSVLPCNRIA